MAAAQQDVCVAREASKKVSYNQVWQIPSLEPLAVNELLAADKCLTVKTEVANTSCTWLFGIRKISDPALPYYRSLYLESRICEIKGNIPAGIETTLKIHKTERKTSYAVGKREQFWVGYVNDGNNPVLVSGPSGAISIGLIFHEQECAENRQDESFATRSANLFKENMVNLLVNEETSDLKIIASDGVEMAAHKLILQAQNPVFASMLRSDLSESKTGVVHVDDIGGKTMKVILHYLYTGDLPTSWSDADIIVEFTYAAGKYQLTEVLRMLDASLGNDMSDDHNLCITPLLSLASKLSLPGAERRLIEQFRKQALKAQTADELFALMGYHGGNTMAST